MYILIVQFKNTVCMSVRTSIELLKFLEMTQSCEVHQNS